MDEIKRLRDDQMKITNINLIEELSYLKAISDLRKVKHYTCKNIVKYAENEDTTSFIQNTEAERILSKKFPLDISRKILYFYHLAQLQIDCRRIIVMKEEREVLRDMQIHHTIEKCFGRLISDLIHCRDRSVKKLAKYVDFNDYSSFVQENVTKIPTSEAQEILSKKFPIEIAMRILYWYHFQKLNGHMQEIAGLDAELEHPRRGMTWNFLDLDDVAMELSRLFRCTDITMKHIRRYQGSSFLQMNSEKLTLPAKSEAEMILSKRFGEDVSRRILHFYHLRKMETLTYQMYCLRSRMNEMVLLHQANDLDGFYRMDELATQLSDMNYSKSVSTEYVRKYVGVCFLQTHKSEAEHILSQRFPQEISRKILYIYQLKKYANLQYQIMAVQLRLNQITPRFQMQEQEEVPVDCLIEMCKIRFFKQRLSRMYIFSFS